MNSQENNLPVKSKSRKKIIIGVVIAVLLLVGGGIIFYFYQKKPKSQNSDNSPVEEEEEEEEDDFKPAGDDFDEHGPYKSRGYVDPESNYSTYKLANIPNITEKKAKEEVITYLWHHGGKNWSKEKLEIWLPKNAQRIDLADKLEDDWDIDNYVKWMEKISKKYQENIFSNPPSQSEFETKTREVGFNFFFLIWSFDLEYKNKEIDWIASFKSLLKPGRKRKRETKSGKKKNFQKAADIIEREINHFIMEEGRKFPNLADLKQLNQWTNTFGIKIEIAERLICSRWYLSKSIGKKIPPPDQTKKVQTNDPKLKNKTFNLQPVLTIYKVREEN
ncbi:MAG: hypothetical protein I3273_07135 [Candidatus Moeniiplasma glomeromycotorum]|nr:hypothetical protein [Candidatus Moeniiplasma glomeromycotorum]MCE8168386.1 hypothetical protein [Candidatus Moeniiplasma glomeromycotorum]MCE8169860.1 hypothetical protein [Candidatus Moeniiplasma glomeromycotorum]